MWLIAALAAAAAYIARKRRSAEVGQVSLEAGVPELVDRTDQEHDQRPGQPHV